MSDNSLYNTLSADKGSSPTKEFFESNSLVAKFAFLLLVVIGFVVLLNVGMSILAYFLKPNESPHLINGMIEAKEMIIFPQDPSDNDAVTIFRSNNAKDGIEFTWSSWLFINSVQGNPGVFKHVFSKGNSEMTPNGIIQPNNAPGLYIAPNTNTLVVIMNTYNVINEEIMIPDIPMNKWVNVIIRCKNTTLDVYINGTIARSVNLMGVPKQNYGDVYVGMNGGFDGYISNLWYYNYSLGTTDIQNIVNSGPDTTLIRGNGLVDRMYNYLSLRWFFYGAGNGFNPDNRRMQMTKM